MNCSFSSSAFLYSRNNPLLLLFCRLYTVCSSSRFTLLFCFVFFCISWEIILCFYFWQSSRAPSVEDDEDGHLLYRNGDLLQNRCKYSPFLYFHISFPFHFKTGCSGKLDSKFLSWALTVFLPINLFYFVTKTIRIEFQLREMWWQLCVCWHRKRTRGSHLLVAQCLYLVSWHQFPIHFFSFFQQHKKI